MKEIIYILVTVISFTGCSTSKHTVVPKSLEVQKNSIEIKQEKIEKKEILQEKKEVLVDTNETNLSEISSAEILFDKLPKTYLLKDDFSELPNWEDENYALALDSFLNSCKTEKTQKLYKHLCIDAAKVHDAKSFFHLNFKPYKINTKDGQDQGLLTGYYEPQLRGSLKKTKKFRYPIHKTPKDLIVVDLSSIYPNLKNYRLRGKLEGNKLVPYYSRKQSKSKHLDADVICYTDSKIDRFFLEIQGSGRVTLRDGKTIFLGYDNQNGHRYKAIGRYLYKIGALKKDEISLQTIRAWLDKNPSRVDEVLNYNKSLVFFKERFQPASGALGVELTAKRSIAVDRKYIPLGSMLYLSAEIDDNKLSKVVLAQDTGGAIKGAIRADMFLGYGDEAMNMAGELKAPLTLWILLPKSFDERSI